MKLWNCCSYTSRTDFLIDENWNLFVNFGTIIWILSKDGVNLIVLRVAEMIQLKVIGWFCFVFQMNDQKKLMKFLQEVEEKAGEILTDKEEVLGLDKRRNDDRVGMRALQKLNQDKVWLTVGPLLIKMEAKAAEDLLVQGTKDVWHCFLTLKGLKFITV